MMRQFFSIVKRIKTILKKDFKFFNKIHDAIEGKSVKYRKWHQIPHVSKIHFAILISVFFPIWLLLPSLEQDFQINAGQGQKVVKKKIVSNKVIIKLKKDSKGKLKNPKAEKINPKDTGLKSLDNINKKFAVKELRKVVKESKKSKTASPVFDYYISELPYEEKILTADGISSNDNYIDKNGFKISEQAIKQVIEEYKKDPNVEMVEPVQLLETQAIPTDPRYSELWAMPKIQAPQAWNITGGDSDVTVGVIDTGIDFNHEDLQGNIWTNSGETGGGKETNGIDDDANGYIDDWRGWDFADNNNNPLDGHGHGTHVSGTVAAVANNGKGVVGLAWGTKIMAVKGLSDNGSGYTSNLAAAIVYAADNGAKVLNNSWGGYGTSFLITSAINYAHDENNVVVVAAAGNENDDAYKYTPAGIENVITVAATDSSDVKASFSNYGEKIDVAAPGVSILSSTPGNGYSSWSGTSMASPHVAALSALILSKYNVLSPEQVRLALHGTADDLGSPGKDIYFGYGRINASQAVQIPAISNVEISSPYHNQAVFGRVDISGSASGETFRSYRLEYKKASDSNWTFINASSTQINEGVLGSLDTTSISFNDGQYYIRLTVTDTAGNTFDVIRKVLVDNIPAVISVPEKDRMINTSESQVEVTGTASVNTDVFDRYQVEVLKDNSTSWSTEGITLSSNGTVSVSGGTLATWNVGNLTYGDYQIKLTVWDKSGKSDIYTVPIFMESQLVQEWGEVTDGVEMGVTTYDVDGDGKKEVAFSRGTNLPTADIHLYKSDGTPYPGWPKTLDIYTDFPGAEAVQLHNPPTLADINNDGKAEVIISVSSAYFLANGRIQPKVYVFDLSGNVMPGWPKTIAEWSLRSYPAVDDINNDGFKEIAIRTEENINDGKTRLYIFKPDGTNLTGWPQVLGGLSMSEYGILSSSPVFYDINNDGQKEIFVGNYDGLVYGFRNDGTKLAGWPRGFSQNSWFGQPITSRGSVRNTPTISDINMDGKPEVVVTIEDINEYYDVVYAWDINGNVMPGWPKYIGGQASLGSNLIADIDKNGDKEIISAMGANVRAWHHDGKDVAGWGDLYWSLYSSPAAGDINNDGFLEVVLAIFDDYDHRIIAMSKNGNVVWNRKVGCTVSKGCYWQNPVIADIDNDNKIEIIGSSTLTPGLAVWELGETKIGDTNPWPKFNGNDSNTGAYDFLDYSQPITAMSSPVAESTVSGTVPITVSASDNMGISRVKYYVDNVLKHTQWYPNSGTNYKYAWNSKSVMNGSHSIKVKVYDVSALSSETQVNINVKNSLSPVYRFWSSTYGDHYYTTSLTERNRLINNYPDKIWKYQGIAFYVPISSGTKPVYRFWSSTYGDHYYTTSLTERNRLINNYPDKIWKYQGIAFYIP